MKITEYPTAQFFDADDVLIKDGTNGTKQIKASDAVYALFDPIPEMHKEIFRGKSLGSTFTAAQQQALSDGSFHDLWLGDYWESGETKYRIVDFDYYYNTNKLSSDSASNVLSHHLVVMPDDGLTDTQTAFGSSASSWKYTDSILRTGSTMSQTRSVIQSFFGGDHICSHRDNCIVAVRFKGSTDDSVYTDRTLITMTIEVPSVYHILGLPNNIARSGNWQYVNQFRLFQLRPEYIPVKDKNYWTKDISSYSATSNNYAAITISNRSNTNEIRTPTNVTVAATIRPYFCLKG